MAGPIKDCLQCDGKGWFRKWCTKKHDNTDCYVHDCYRLRQCLKCNKAGAIPNPHPNER